MSSSFSSSADNGRRLCRLLVAYFVAIGVLLLSVGCTREMERVPEHRQQGVLELDARSYALASDDQGFDDLARLAAVPAGMTACRYLNFLPESTDPTQNFRLLEDIFVESTGRAVVDDEKGREACAKLTRKNDPEEVRKLWELCRNYKASPAGSINLNNIYGKVDMAASPLYQYSLLKHEPIPDEAASLKIVEKEFSSTSQDLLDYVIPKGSIWRKILFPILFPLQLIQSFLPMEVFKIAVLHFALDAGWVDIIDERNAKIESQINNAFPGAFDDESRFYELKGSFPDIIFRNGTPTLSQLAISDSDGPQERLEKTRKVDGILKNYVRPVALFSPGGWGAFRRDMETGMAVALRGFTSQDPEEQACGTALFHRGLAQLLTIMGYPRAPIVRAANARGGAHLPRADELLESRKGTEFRVCNTGGSFGRNGLYKMLLPEDLGNYQPTDAPETYMALSAVPRAPEECRVADSKPYRLGDNVVEPRATNRVLDVAQGKDLADFISGVSHFMMAFNPSAKWWPVGTWPLSKFNSLEQIQKSQGFLPFEAHLLALAYMGVGVKNLAAKHLVFIDRAGRETTESDPNLLGIRISDVPRNPGSGGVITNHIHSTVVMAQLIYKLSATFGSLGEMSRLNRGTLTQSSEELQKSRSIAIAALDDMNSAENSLSQAQSGLSAADAEVKEAKRHRNGSPEERERYRMALENQQKAAAVLEESKSVRAAALMRRDSAVKSVEDLSTSFQSLDTGYRDFVEGLFSSEENLLYMANDAKGSVREELDKLKFASALLLMAYGKHDAQGLTTCVQTLRRDLNTGNEESFGDCSPEDRAEWKLALRRAGNHFSSPVLLKMAE